MRIAVANSDFSVALIDEKTQANRFYQVANGEDLKIISSGQMTGIVKLGGAHLDRVVVGYLVEIEGQVVFVDENLLEVSK